jgi:hypothetical protein
LASSPRLPLPSMSKKPNATGPAAHWHIDCRIESELPEDNIVGTRFLINVLCGAVAVAALLFAGWLGYLDLSTRRQTRDWEQRLTENNAEVRDLQRMQRDYAIEAGKIDEAHRLIKPRLFVTGFLANLGRSRPAPLVIDAIEWNELTITVRGSIREKSERATALLGNYVKALGKDEMMGPLFREIRLTGFDRGIDDGAINCEICFYLKGPPKP